MLWMDRLGTGEGAGTKVFEVKPSLGSHDGLHSADCERVSVLPSSHHHTLPPYSQKHM